MSTNIIRNIAMLIKSFKFAQSHIEQDGSIVCKYMGDCYDGRNPLIRGYIWTTKIAMNAQQTNSSIFITITNHKEHVSPSTQWAR